MESKAGVSPKDIINIRDSEKTAELIIDSWRTLEEERLLDVEEQPRSTPGDVYYARLFLQSLAREKQMEGLLRDAYMGIAGMIHGKDLLYVTKEIRKFLDNSG